MHMHLCNLQQINITSGHPHYHPLMKISEKYPEISEKYSEISVKYPGNFLEQSHQTRTSSWNKEEKRLQEHSTQLQGIVHVMTLTRKIHVYMLNYSWNDSDNSKNKQISEFHFRQCTVAIKGTVYSTANEAVALNIFFSAKFEIWFPYSKLPLGPKPKLF